MGVGRRALRRIMNNGDVLRDGVASVERLAASREAAGIRARWWG